MSHDEANHADDEEEEEEEEQRGTISSVALRSPLLSGYRQCLFMKP